MTQAKTVPARLGESALGPFRYVRCPPDVPITRAIATCSRLGSSRGPISATTAAGAVGGHLPAYRAGTEGEVQGLKPGNPPLSGRLDVSLLALHR